MLKNRREAAQKVAAGLFALEEAIDLALTKSAELNAILPAARAEANLSAVVGQEAFEGAVEVFASLAAARRHIVETHKRLGETKSQIGLRTVAVGDGGEKPPPQAFRVLEGGNSAAA
jgi:hypothetical protein